MADNEYKNIVLKLGDESVLFIERKNKIIPVKIDTEDLDKVGKYRWHAILDKTCKEPSYYICHRYANKSGKGCIKLHRLIMNCPRDKEIDHINHITTDNRKSNLRIVTRFENQQNLRSCSSGVTGVYKHNRGYWVSNITINGTRYRKEFKTKEEAIAYRYDMERYRKEVING